MSRRIIVVVVMLAGSLVLGILAGEQFFQLFRRTVPPAVLTSFNAAAAHAAFVGYGLVAGLVIFLWSLLVLALGGLLRKRPA